MSSKYQVIVADPPWSFSDSLKMSDIKRSAQANYATMRISDIQRLPVKDICHPDGAVLCLWVPGSLLPSGLDTMKAWGFEHKQTYVWVKTKKEPLKSFKKSILKGITSAAKLATDLSKKDTKHFFKSFALTLANKAESIDLSNLLSFGMGRLFRQTHEICLIGTSDNRIYQELSNKSRRSVCFDQNAGHSIKPEALQNSLELMFPKAQKLELFARRIRPGWTCLGNGVCGGEDITVSLSKL